MALVIVIVAIVLLLAAIGWSARRAITVCVIDVRDGKATIARGAIAPRILADIRDVTKRPRLKRATIRIVRDRGRAKVEITGDASDTQRQQLRNVIGSIPLAKLVNAPRKRS